MFQDRLRCFRQCGKMQVEMKHTNVDKGTAPVSCTPTRRSCDGRSSRVQGMNRSHLARDYEYRSFGRPGPACLTVGLKDSYQPHRPVSGIGCGNPSCRGRRSGQCAVRGIEPRAPAVASVLPADPAARIVFCVISFFRSYTYRLPPPSSYSPRCRKWACTGLPGESIAICGCRGPFRLKTPARGVPPRGLLAHAIEISGMPYFASLYLL